MEIDQKYPYYSIGVDESLKKLLAKKEGLTSQEAQRRQKEFGKNILPEKGGTKM